MANETLSWLPPDADGISTAWISDPTRASLRGKRLRRAFNRPQPMLDTWPAAWRTLLAQWVRRADAATHYRCATLLERAGAQQANTAFQLLHRLLADGLVEIQERRDPQHRDWQAHSLRFIDPAALRRALALPEPDTHRRQWNTLRDTPLALPQLAAARATLTPLPPKVALERLQLLIALQRWHDEHRHRSQATRRDFAWFACADTKKITDSQWRWLAETVDLAAFGISAHAPLLYLAADLTLQSAAGSIELGALPGFIGLPPQALQAIIGIHRPPLLWRVVENRSAFEKAAATRAAEQAVLWLPGYPPGWWAEAVSRLLALAPAALAIACDPDPDGIAIALQTARLWQEAGQPWSPWQMSAAALRSLAHRRPLSERDRQLLHTLRAQTLPEPLAELADAMVALGEKGEQESLFWSLGTTD
ncbi:DUF2399 domain-containing protein [Pseudothauera hydrothermalis]|uniref:DUF2399 domain-containing protein n=1 Tax=Pseudothauera hydrothermalis TaxID=2184083 RepID=UPI000E09CB3E|nr:DUF2399 domain-containing protein [Pseudothauera hydrothermalis]